MDLCERLISHAQNEEMINQNYTEHGEDCLLAVKEIIFLRAKVEKMTNGSKELPRST